MKVFEMRGLLIIKLGGSAITDKRRGCVAKRKVIDEISGEVAKVKERLILIHGAGSFGHPIVKEYGIHLGFRNRSQLTGYAETKYRLTELTRIILEALRSHKVPAAPFMPSSFMVAENGRLLKVEVEPLERLLELGLVPVLHGDIVADTKMGFSVVSGDQIAAYLAEKMNARMVIFGCDVDGVFTADPKTNRKAELIRVIKLSTVKDVMRSVGGPAAPDVTQGMLGKLKEGLRLVEKGIEVVIMNLTKPEGLTSIVEGRDARCTRFVPN
jgi:isopentenyl phosphate kinase